jgi:hypothetical protein
MEILIPGLALVALMVYVSTRIKRSAAKAFNEEFIETDDFAITKPEGFIIPNDVGDFAFAAYSKEFGPGETDKIRQASAELRIHENATLEETRDAIVAEAREVVDEQHLAGRSIMLETKTSRDGFILETENRLVEKDGKVFALSVAALPETKHEQERNINTLLTTFEVK